MELDELKQAWAETDLRQDGMEALLRADFHERRIGGARAALRPLLWGQSLQLALGVALSLWGGGLWASHLHDVAVLVCGAVVHAYGVLLIIFAAHNLYLMRRIDFAAPVLDIQRRLARLRAFRVRVETPANFIACCFMWIPVAWFALAALGIHVALGGFLLWAFTSSFAGLLGIAAGVWVLRRLGQGYKVDDSNAGRSVVRAQAALDEIARFVRE